jgi:hypothetical protein
MTLDHEYVLLGGPNRAKLGHYLSGFAGAASGATVFILLTIVGIAKRFGIVQQIPPVVLSLASAGTIYGVLYWLFSSYVWRWPWVSRWLRVPNLSGRWRCEGQTINPDKTPSYAWKGDVTITQNWDKIRVRLKTSQSGSNSIAAALLWDDVDGYRLLYHYRNDPAISETDLKSHRGFAELVFAEDGLSASGEYFNGLGRFTFGTMKLTREKA